MAKAIIFILILSLFIVGVTAQNYEYKYSPYTAKLDRTTSLNQSGNNGTFSNLTVDNLEVVNSPVNCLVNTGMIGTNMTTSTCSNNITDWWVIGSNLVYMGGNVGVGNVSPKHLLDVGGMQGIGAPGNLGIKSDSGDKAIRIEENSGVEGWHIGVDVDGDLNFDDSNTGIRLTFQDETGNVGIGTQSPAKDLEIYSSSPILRLRDSGLTASQTLAYIEFGGTDATAWNRTGFVGDGSSGNADISLQAEVGDLHLGDSSGSTVMNLKDGNVGIGTTTPSAKLVVDGTMLILNTSGRALMNVTNTYVSFPGIAGTDNNIIGEGAGISLLSTGTDNVCVGDNACDDLTTGDDNVIIGADAGTAATTNKGVLIGQSAGGTQHSMTAIGWDVTGGSFSVAIGQSANSASSRSIAIGASAISQAGFGVAIGDTAKTADGVTVGYHAGDAQTAADVDNVLIGYEAGTAITGTGTDNVCVGDLACDSLTSGDGNVFIGADTDGTTTTTNSIAIGFGATCNFNNAAAFGAGATCTRDNMLAIGSPTSNLDTVIYGGLNVTENITADNVFLLADISVHTNATIPVASAGVWYNVTFDDGIDGPVKDISHTYNDGTNDTFTIVHTGTYEIRYTVTVADSNPTPGTHVAVRLIKNGVEIDGSLLEEDSTRQYADFTIGNGPHADLTAGDEIKLQFTASDTSVSMESHQTYGDHKDSATVKMKRIR